MYFTIQKRGLDSKICFKNFLVYVYNVKLPRWPCQLVCIRRESLPDFRGSLLFNILFEVSSWWFLSLSSLYFCHDLTSPASLSSIIDAWCVFRRVLALILTWKNEKFAQRTFNALKIWVFSSQSLGFICLLSCLLYPSTHTDISSLYSLSSLFRCSTCRLNWKHTSSKPKSRKRLFSLALCDQPSFDSFHFYLSSSH